MKAIIMNEYGDSSVLQYVDDFPDPILKDDDVLIEVKAAAVNPIDWKLRQGYLKQMIDIPFPFILGLDVSGVVKEVGKEVTMFQPGDEVYARADTSRNGSYAEKIAVNQLFVSKKPSNLNFEEAASVPLAALTAYQALRDFAGLDKGERVFISAGSGGVGSFAIQIAKILGAYVVTTTGPNNIDYVKSLGADEVIDYTKNDSLDIEPVDVVFDLIGGKSQIESFSILKEGGRIGSIAGTPDPKLAKEKRANAKGLWVKSSGADLDELRNYIEAGKIKTEIAARFPLEKVKVAHELSETGHVRGKIVIEVAK